MDAISETRQNAFYGLSEGSWRSCTVTAKAADSGEAGLSVIYSCSKFSKLVGKNSAHVGI